MKNNLVKCPQCDLNFLSREGMEKHGKRVHAPKDSSNMPRTRFKCENCDEEFSTKLDFKKHREPQKLLCKKCQEDKKKFICDNKCELIKHVRKMHKKDLMIKKQNLLESKKQEKLQKKFKNFTPRHQCVKCNKVFKDNNFLELHMREEHSAKEIKKEKADSLKRPYTTDIQKSNKARLESKTRANISRIESPTPTTAGTVIGGEVTNYPKITTTTIITPPQPQVSEPSEQFYYKTFTADELVKLGIFTYDSPSLYEPPMITGDLEPEPSNSITEPEPEEYEPPSTCEGLFILGL